MKITDINKTRRGRISVYVDEEFLTAVEVISWSESGLKIGTEVDTDTLNKLVEHSRIAEGKRRALNMLSARSYTKKQLTQKLSQKSGKEAAQAVSNRMEEIGLINDEDYALRYTRELYNNKMYAKKRIVYELSKKGISSDYIDLAFEELELVDDEVRAQDLLVRRFGEINDETQERKAASLLERYGYSHSAIKKAIAAVKNFIVEDEW